MEYPNNKSLFVYRNLFSTKSGLVNHSGWKSYIINKDEIKKPRAPLFKKKEKVARNDINKYK